MSTSQQQTRRPGRPKAEDAVDAGQILDVALRAFARYGFDGMWFAKFANSLTGSGKPIVLPAAHSEYVDYEAELALSVAPHETSLSRTRSPASPVRCPSTT